MILVFCCKNQIVFFEGFCCPELKIDFFISPSAEFYETYLLKNLFYGGFEAKIKQL